MLHIPYCSPSTSRATKKSEANYFLPGLVTQSPAAILPPKAALSIAPRFYI